MKRFILFVAFFVVIAMGCNDGKEIVRKDPLTITVTDIVNSDDNRIIYRHVRYKFDAVSYDTVEKSNSLGIDTRSIKPKTIDDVIDLNTIFRLNDDDETDYNYTELDDDDWDYLNKIGVYWDSDNGCYRIRRNP
jgi:hypothetical protein